MYSWDIRLFAETYLNSVIRKAKHIALLYALTKPMELLYDDFLAFKTNTDLLVRYSGQTKSLEVLLNNIFDAEEERIYIITDGDGLALFTYYRAEKTSFYSQYRDEVGYTPKYTYARSEDVTLTNDFTVHVPTAIASAKTIEINSWVNRYKIAGKRHTIKPI